MTGAAKPPRRRKAERPDEIVAAALAEFAARGFAATRIDDVARRAGIGKGTVYLYFDSKEALFRAVVRRAIVPRIDEVTALIAAHDGPTPDLMRVLLKQLLRRVIGTEASALVRLVIAEGPAFPDLAEAYHREVISRGLAVFRGLVERGVRRGEFRPTALGRFPQLIVAPALLAVIWRALFEPYQPLDVDALVDAHVDLLAAALVEGGA